MIIRVYTVKEAQKSMTDTWLCVMLGFSTGGRWSEVSHIDLKHITPQYVKFTQTKSKKARTVPISTSLYELIHQNCKSDILRGSYHAFRDAMKRTDIQLPKGQSSHVMRHTFASHFMINGGDILTLQRLLGHSNLQMTTIYAHLAPNALDKAKAFNPVANGHIMDTL